MQSLFGPHNHNMESPLCYNANLDTPFSPLMSTFSFCINHWDYFKFKVKNVTKLRAIIGTIQLFRQTV